MTEITGRLSTALADRYQIEKRLGEGGMATVYLADDLKHKRKVAVKSLATRTVSDLGQRRYWWYWLACRQSTEYWMGCPACRS